MITIIALSARSRFQLGQIVATPGAIDACSPEYLAGCLRRHARGDWGLSSYALDPSKPSKGFGDNTLWIITESDRSVTTFLLPSEY
jgi:hypothetical protein